LRGNHPETQMSAWDAEAGSGGCCFRRPSARSPKNETGPAENNIAQFSEKVESRKKEEPYSARSRECVITYWTLPFPEKERSGVPHRNKKRETPPSRHRKKERVRLYDWRYWSGKKTITSCRGGDSKRLKGWQGKEG